MKQLYAAEADPEELTGTCRLDAKLTPHIGHPNLLGGGIRWYRPLSTVAHPCTTQI